MVELNPGCLSSNEPQRKAVDSWTNPVDPNGPRLRDTRDHDTKVQPKLATARRSELCWRQGQT